MSDTRQLVDVSDYWPTCDQPYWGRRSRDGTEIVWGSELAPLHQDVLTRAIESEIIPRLLLAHSKHDETVLAEEGVNARSPSAEEIEEFVRLLLTHEIFASRSFVTALTTRGTRLDLVLLGLFAPAARRLGEYWIEDVCSFAEVTIALSRLQQLLRELSPNFVGDTNVALGAPSVFLTVMPGEQHTFGLLVVQEFFRKAGWRVCGGIYDNADELQDAARGEPYDVIGLSVSCDAPTENLSNFIAALRKNASNSAVQVAVGGRFFLEHPELVAYVGADATAPDGRRAVTHLSNLLDITGVRY